MLLVYKYGQCLPWGKYKTTGYVTWWHSNTVSVAVNWENFFFNIASIRVFLWKSFFFFLRRKFLTLAYDYDNEWRKPHADYSLINLFHSISTELPTQKEIRIKYKQMKWSIAKYSIHYSQFYVYLLFDF